MMLAEQLVKRQINYKAMRVIVGVIAILLSPTVWWLSGCGDRLTSISISYWTDSRDILVGALIAVGFFLSAYNGTGKKGDWEYRLSRLACVFAICIALFPTEGFPNKDIPAWWISGISSSIGLTPDLIHKAASVLFFVCLIVLMWFFSKRAQRKGKLSRMVFYRTVCVMMVVGITGFLLLWKILDWKESVFWAEAWGLTLFGLGWLVAGTYKSSIQDSQS